MVIVAFVWPAFGGKGQFATSSRITSAKPGEELKKCTWPTWEELKVPRRSLSLSIALLGVFYRAGLTRFSPDLVSTVPKEFHAQASGLSFIRLSGQEQKVKESIEKRVKTEEMQDYIKEVLVPMEKVVEVRNQKKTVSNRKLWPGYVFVDMVLLDEDKPDHRKAVVFHPGNAGCHRLCWSDPPHADADRTKSEAIKAQISASEETEKPKVNFEVGETIKINNGPFLNFSGVIEEIEPERGKLKVTVNIFGRNTPVELEYWQVEKA